MERTQKSRWHGFRDIESFNLAKFVKQGWRLLQHPHSLVSRIFKAKYFPNTNFLEAKLGSKPSYAWRSISVWRVGNGESIKIWGDRWIMSPTSYAIQSPI